MIRRVLAPPGRLETIPGKKRTPHPDEHPADLFGLMDAALNSAVSVTCD
jgi:hypothetical protein